VDKWQKWKFQIAAATLLIPRILLVVISVIICAIIAKIVTIGVTVSEERPLKGWRNSIILYCINLNSRILIFLSGFRKTEMRMIDWDYSWYLGED